jgi:hypothetical protein
MIVRDCWHKITKLLAEISLSMFFSIVIFLTSNWEGSGFYAVVTVDFAFSYPCERSRMLLLMCKKVQVFGSIIEGVLDLDGLEFSDRSSALISRAWTLSARHWTRFLQSVHLPHRRVNRRLWPLGSLLLFGNRPRLRNLIAPSESPTGSAVVLWHSINCYQVELQPVTRNVDFLRAWHVL